MQMDYTAIGHSGIAVQRPPRSEARLAELELNLRKKLGPEYHSKRTGGGASKLTYIEGWKAIDLANEIFGHDGTFTLLS